MFYLIVLIINGLTFDLKKINRKQIQKQKSFKIILIFESLDVAKYRKQKGLSQLDLSLQMGYKSVSVVSGAEIYYNGKHFNLEHLLKISQILDVDISEFLKP